jgi:sugar lactone lactonase YvrE
MLEYSRMHHIILRVSFYGFKVSYPLIGVTVAGYSNGTSGTTLDALNSPWGLAIDTNDTLYISECGNARVIRIPAGSLNGSIVAGTGSSGSSATQLGCPAELKIDTHSNLYVDDNNHCRVMLWRKNASSGVVVVGNGTCSNTNNGIGDSLGLARDSQGNLYVSDKDNHRIMKWPPNATVGILVAGTPGVSGNSNQLLNNPYGLYLDEHNSYLYVADTGNNRIQRYTLGTAANGTTVAGGNGPGSNSNQLNGPHSVYVSMNNGDIYIADRVNNRIQRWSTGASSGVTIAGVSGMNGVDASMLNSPVGVIMNMNETFLYVSDRDNNRVQRYQLI